MPFKTKGSESLINRDQGHDDALLLRLHAPPPLLIHAKKFAMSRRKRKREDCQDGTDTGLVESGAAPLSLPPPEQTSTIITAETVSKLLDVLQATLQNKSSDEVVSAVLDDLGCLGIDEVAHLVPRDHAVLLLSEDVTLDILEKATSISNLTTILFVLLLPKIHNNNKPPARKTLNKCTGQKK